MSASGVIQPATTIAKTTQTQMGQIIGVEGYSFITIFLDYTKGDETGVIVVPSFLHRNEANAPVFPYGIWTPTGGVNAFTTETFKMLATGKFYFMLDVEGMDFVKLTQGGSNNDGTPTGTLAAYYTAK